MIEGTVHTITIGNATFIADPSEHSIGRRNNCWSSPTCTWRKARASRGAACCCRPTTAR